MTYAIFAFFIGVFICHESHGGASNLSQNATALKEKTQGYKPVDPNTDKIDVGENWRPEKKSFLKSKVDYLKRGGSCTKSCTPNACYDAAGYSWCAKNCGHKINLGSLCAYSRIKVENNTGEVLSLLFLPERLDEGRLVEGLKPKQSSQHQLSLGENQKKRIFTLAVTPDDFNQQDRVKDSVTVCKDPMKIGVDYDIVLENYGQEKTGEKTQTGFFGRLKNSAQGTLKNNPLNYGVRCEIKMAGNQKAFIKSPAVK